MSAAGLSSAFEVECGGEAVAQVTVSSAQNGRQRTSAVVRPDRSDEVKLAVTLSVSGSCLAAGPIYFTGRADPLRERALPLPRGPKRLPLGRRSDLCVLHAKTCQVSTGREPSASPNALVHRVGIRLHVGGWIIQRVRGGVRRRGGGAGHGLIRAEWAATYLCSGQCQSDGWAHKQDPKDN